MPDKKAAYHAESFVMSIAYDENNELDPLLVIGDKEGNVIGAVKGIEAKTLFDNVKNACTRSQE